MGNVAMVLLLLFVWGFGRSLLGLRVNPRLCERAINAANMYYELYKNERSIEEYRKGLERQAEWYLEGPFLQLLYLNPLIWTTDQFERAMKYIVWNRHVKEAKANRKQVD